MKTKANIQANLFKLILISQKKKNNRELKIKLPMIAENRVINDNFL